VGVAHLKQPLVLLEVLEEAVVILLLEALELLVKVTLGDLGLHLAHTRGAAAAAQER